MKHYILLIIVICFSHIIDAQTKSFTILHTSDEHSALLPTPLSEYHPEKEDETIGGFARLATKIKEIRTAKNNENLLLFSSGDIFGGSPFSWLILQQQAAELELMKAMKYDAVTVGNHEFDYGSQILADYYKNAGYHSKNQKTSIISSNLNIPKNHGLDSIHFEENKIYTLENGLKIGVFGILGKDAFELVTDSKPIDIFDPFDIAKQQVKKLKEAGADVIIALTHSGINEDRLLAKKVKGIHLILGGHDHIKTEKPEKVKNTLIFHPSYYAKFLGQLELDFDTEKNELKLNEKQTSCFIPINDNIEEDKAIKKQIESYVKSLNTFIEKYSKGEFTAIEKSVISSEFDLLNAHFKETGLGNFITDGMRLIGEEIIGEKVDFALQANGVIRSDIKAGKADWSKNEVPFFDMVTASCLGKGPDNSPGYPLVSVYLTEEEIFNALEITTLLAQVYGDIFFLQYSGLRYTYNPKNAIRFKLPFISFPLPKFKAVYLVEQYKGEGIQDDENYQAIGNNADKLYHVVTDYYIASFLPKIGDILPKRKVVLKDKNGKAVELKECIVMNGEQEFKVWEAFSLYAKKLNEEGKMPNYYANPQNRINPTDIKSKKKFLKD